MASWADIVKKNLTDHGSKDGIVSVSSSSPSSSSLVSKGDHAKSFFHIDGGVNLTHRNLNNRIDKIVQDAIAYNCRRFIVISHSVPDCKKVISLTRSLNKNSNNRFKVYCTLGVQPHDAERTLKDSNWVTELEKLIIDNKDIVVAVGKCGLDYERTMLAPLEAQKEVFAKQLELAKKHNLPLFLHERNAQDDFLDMLDSSDKNHKGVIHCFTGNEESAGRYVQHNLFFGITGRICDDAQNEDLVKSVINVIPEDKLIISTDAPYMTPKDLKKRPYYNGPQFIPHICARIAYVKGMRRNELSTIVMQNMKNLFPNFT